MKSNHRASQWANLMGATRSLWHIFPLLSWKSQKVWGLSYYIMGKCNSFQKQKGEVSGEDSVMGRDAKEEGSMEQTEREHRRAGWGERSVSWTKMTIFITTRQCYYNVPTINLVSEQLPLPATQMQCCLCPYHLWASSWVLFKPT